MSDPSNLVKAFSDLLEIGKTKFVHIWWGARPAEIKADGFTEVVGMHASASRNRKDHDAALAAMMSDDRWKAALKKPELPAVHWVHKFFGSPHWNEKLMKENLALREKLAAYHEHMVDLGREALRNHVDANLIAGIQKAEKSYRLFTFEAEEAALKEQVALLARKLSGMERAHSSLYTAWMEAHISNPSFVAKPPEKETPSPDASA